VLLFLQLWGMGADWGGVNGFISSRVVPAACVAAAVAGQGLAGTAKARSEPREE